MILTQEIAVNQYGQGLISMDNISKMFNELSLKGKRGFLTYLANIITQSKPYDKDIEIAINNSKLKTTFTPCVLLKKGVSLSNLIKISNLPDNESGKVLILFLSLFKIAYQRRFKQEKNHPHKWWYWDLSNKENIDIILNNRLNDK